MFTQHLPTPVQVDVGHPRLRVPVQIALWTLVETLAAVAFLLAMWAALVD